MELLGVGLKEYAAKTGLYLPPFRQRFPWYGADLQTVRNSFVAPLAEPRLDGRLTVPISGGVALSLAVTLPESSQQAGRALVLVHGLGGSEESTYMKQTAHYFAAAGWHVYRMNYRGVGPSKATSSAPYSAGLTGDMRAVLRTVAAQEGIEEMCAMGFSLGGQLLMRTLGEGDVDPKLRAVVSVSAPVDLATSQQRLERRRNGAYVRYLLGNMKADLEGVEHPAIIKPMSEIKSVLAFDEHVIAPYFGFANAQDYYRCVSCKPLLQKIGLPLLAIHAADDPWIPVEDYRQAKWPEKAVAGAVILPHGGHVGFHGSNSKNAWFKPAAEAFFKSILQ